ncbi:LssY C-terminal domain-containing protein [Rathayibacter sp. YIM 133350]|uniref:LssY C-terminal domain-containing protein n=1 Tax=Rathayibacter sp. YIM 133350 TaxID=3131992 RepID=UPI00307D9103
MTASEVVVTRQRGSRRVRYSVSAFLDGFFFIFAGLAAVWLATLVAGEGFQWAWSSVLYFVVFWVLVAYLVLPRLHRILTTIYVPDYFIGRARTSDGLLGDPINLALLGEERDVHTAMARAGWTRADDVTAASSLRIISSTLSRRSYDEAPVSPLFLFGRQQDFAYQQEVAGNPAKRHHVRFWRCPDDWLLPGGRRVEWLAAGTFDRAVGFSLFTLQITHKIDADTDVERDHIVESIRRSSPETRVELIRDFSTGYHSRNGGGDSISTDGDLPIIDVRPDAASTRTASLASEDSEESGATHVLGAPTRSRLEPVRHPRASAAGKRAAFESSLDLALPVRSAPSAKRPVTITMGVALVVLRVIGGAAWLIDIAAGWDQLLRHNVTVIGDVDGALAQAALWVILGIGVIVLGVEVAVVALVYRGVDGARMLVLVVASLGIVLAAVDVAAGGAPITLRTTLVGLSLDILVLLALSSRSARAYSRRDRARGAAKESG